MRYLITGHTGFKGSWLTAILKMQGHEVYGISLPPEDISLYNEANISSLVNDEQFIDICDSTKLNEFIIQKNPEVLIHLAAQPIVRESFKNPIRTYEVNVLGTLNVLEATKNLSSLKAILIITTDKVYKNTNKNIGYTENEPLGGDDPYSSSKAAADLATQSWRASFGRIPISIARAGNVIGGGDYSKDRIVPDLVKAYGNNIPIALRNPKAIRPWQHVLDCLNGYLLVVDSMLSHGIQGEWNFGPKDSEIATVENIVNKFSKFWNFTGAPWIQDNSLNPKEAQTLLLNSNKARLDFGWDDKFDLNQAVAKTIEWYKQENKESITLKQISEFYES